MGFCSALHSKMMLLRSAEKYCDVEIRVQDESFMCHRVVLASASEYFDTLFGGSFMEKDARETVLHDMNVETFGEILRLVYTSEMCKFTASNVFDLLRASLFLRIHSLEEACSKYILENVSSINYAPILVFARSFNMTALIDGVTEHIIQNFRLFYNDNMLLEVTFDDLTFLLDRWTRNKVPFKFEDLLLYFLIRWVHHAFEGRREYFIKLIKSVDFERISPDYVSFMMQYLKDFIDQPDLKEMPELNLPPVMKELISESIFDMLARIRNQDDNIDSTQDSKKRLCLKRKLFKYFAENGKSSANCGKEISASFHNPAFYKDVLGLHVHMECISFDCIKKNKRGEKVKRSEGVKVLTSNKYYPDWIVSGETDAWQSCADRRTVVQESTNRLYCMEIFRDEYNSANNRQTFCTYATIDLKLASSVLASPPVPFGRNDFNICATSENNIYLFTFKMRYKSHERFANDQFSIEEINRGFYCYNCEVDKWFPAPTMKFYQDCPTICVDHNLIYSVYDETIQAFDYRSGKWMKLPQYCNLDHHDHYNSNSCVLQSKLFVSRRLALINCYDTVASKWESISQSDVPSQGLKMLPYNNKLCFLYKYFNNFQKHHLIATYCPITQEWASSEKLGILADSFKPRRTDGHYIYEWNIKDMITFKTSS